MNGENNVLFVHKIHPWVIVSGDIILEKISPIISAAGKYLKSYLNSNLRVIVC